MYKTITNPTQQQIEAIPALQFLGILKRWRKFILIFTGSMILSAIIFSGPKFIPPVYKSEVILYPPNTNSNKILIEKDPRFGADNDVEQQIQILKSGLVRDSLIRKYNLMDHYRIDKSSKVKDYKLNKEYEENVLVDRTRYNSISVTVYDTDPLLAATMANDLIRISDRVKSQILKQNLSLAFSSLETEYISVLHQADVLADSLNHMLGAKFSASAGTAAKTEIVRLKEQIDLQEALLKARKDNKNYLLSLLYEYQNKLQRVSELRWSYDQAAVFSTLTVPSCYVISPAVVNYKKDFPSRSLIVMLAGLAGLLISLSIAIGTEKVRSLYLFSVSE